MADDPDQKPDADPEGEPGDGKPDADKDWKAEAEKWRNLARKHEKAAKDNADAAQRLAEIEESQKTEQERAEEARRADKERADRAERDAARLRVAVKKGLTEVQAKRLQGETEEELEADAEELLATFKPADDDGGDSDREPPRRPRERLRPGTKPDAEPEETDPEKLAAAVPRGAF